MLIFVDISKNLDNIDGVRKVETELTMEALESKLADLKKEQMNQRFQHAAGQMPKTHVMRQTRREIARVKTKLNAAKK